MRLFIALVGAAICLSATCGPARADTRALLAVACPGHGDLAPHVDAAARRYMQRPVVLVALMSVESHCRADAVSRKGARGLMQILGVAASGMTIEERHDPANNIAAGTRWLAMLEVWCGGLPAGLGAYNSGSCHKSRGFARRILATVAKILKHRLTFANS
jgi:soluble lytic murein transglycosylase-like protein